MYVVSRVWRKVGDQANGLLFSAVVRARSPLGRGFSRSANLPAMSRVRARLSLIRAQPCRGQGRVEEKKTLSVKVPPGVDTGDRIRLSGQGEAGANGGPAGDLYVQMNVREHPIFTRDGADLYCEVPISFVHAALGEQLEVPTLEGKVSLKCRLKPRRVSCFD